MKIILDTNFLVYCAKYRIDYIYEIEEVIHEKSELIVLSSVLDELERLKEQVKKRSDRDAFALTLSILEHYIKKGKIKIIHVKKENADESIIEMAKNNKVTVATADKELKRKLKGKARILVVRNKSHLELI